jgi:hypothetical protein
MNWELVGKLGAFAFAALIVVILLIRITLSKSIWNSAVRKLHAENFLATIGGPSVTRAYEERRKLQ